MAGYLIIGKKEFFDFKYGFRFKYCQQLNPYLASMNSFFPMINLFFIEPGFFLDLEVIRW